MKNILPSRAEVYCMYIFKNHCLLDHYFYSVSEAKKYKPSINLAKFESLFLI